MIKTIIKHFVFERCIDVAFEQLTANFINPDMQSAKVKAYIDRIQNQFPEYKLVSISVVDLDGKRSRYADVADLVGEGKYYKKVTFNEIEGISSEELGRRMAERYGITFPQQ